MNIISTVIGITVTLAFFAMLSYTFFPRQTKNLFVRITKKKRFVVCHMRYANTKFEDEFLVVPESDFVTQVRNFSYDLNPKYAVMMLKKRLHFILDENNAIPKHFEKDNNEEIIFQAMEIQNALNNNVLEYLFSKKREILIIGLFIVAIVAVLMIAFTYTKLNELTDKINIIGDMVNSMKVEP